MSSGFSFGFGSPAAAPARPSPQFGAWQVQQEQQPTANRWCPVASCNTAGFFPLQSSDDAAKVQRDIGVNLEHFRFGKDDCDSIDEMMQTVNKMSTEAQQSTRA